MTDSEIQALVARVCDSIDTIDHAIRSSNSLGEDAFGDPVFCLTDAIMGIPSGLLAIAGSLDRIANELRDSRTR